MPLSRRLRAAAPLTLLVLVLLVPAALAHPYLQPAELPAGEVVDVAMVVPHGCVGDGHDRGAGSPTVELAVQVPPQVTVVDVLPADGWQVRVERSDGRITEFGWVADGAASAEQLEFQLRLAVVGTAGEDLYLLVYQACEIGEHRWIGTPDAPADDPAVRLTLSSSADQVSGLPAPTSTSTDEREGATPVRTPAPAAATPAPVEVAAPGTETVSATSIWRWLLAGLLATAAVGTLLLLRWRRPPGSIDGAGPT